jgi:hypothetical protein
VKQRHLEKLQAKVAACEEGEMLAQPAAPNREIAAGKDLTDMEKMLQDLTVCCGQGAITGGQLAALQPWLEEYLRPGLGGAFHAKRDFDFL